MMFIETTKAKITFLVQSQNYRKALLKLVEAKITGSLNEKCLSLVHLLK